MTEIIFVSVFLLCIGYVIGKLFKGLNPFKLLFGVSFGFAIAVGLVETNNNWYTALFIIGFILNFGNPFSRLSSAFDDYRVHSLYKKSLQKQKAGIEKDLEDQVKQASNHYSQKAEELKREKERLDREKAEFEQSRARNARQEGKKTVQESEEESMKLLGLQPGFTKQELKKAYKRESMKYHPDRGAGQPEHIKKLMELKFKEVVSAYNYLESII
jgi:DnaJ-domain-containing protein 1